MIKPGETTEVQVFIITGFHNLDRVAGHYAIIELIAGDEILDESNILLPTGAFGYTHTPRNSNVC